MIKKAFFLYLFIACSAFLFTSCQPTSSNYSYSPSTPETAQCRAARSQYKICYGNCLMVTPGTTLSVMGKCGNNCMNYSMQVASMCN